MRFVPLGSEPVSSPDPSEGEGSCGTVEGFVLTALERDMLRQAWLAMRRQKPELHQVLEARRREWKLRGQGSKYNHEVSRGFYTRLAKRLGITPQTVCYRLKAGMDWLADWIKHHGQSQEI